MQQEVVVRALSRKEIVQRLDELAQLRIQVFAAFPYLYDGDPEYERRYLQPYVDSEQAIVVAALDGDRLVGAATATPMEDHAADFQAAFAYRPEPLDSLFYCAESVLLPAWRGRGLGHRFFDLREEQARRLGRAACVFCAVIRPDDHPARPPQARSLEPFWRKRGYRPLPGVIAHYAWRDHGDAVETDKPLQFWMRVL